MVISFHLGYLYGNFSSLKENSMPAFSSKPFDTVGIIAIDNLCLNLLGKTAHKSPLPSFSYFNKNHTTLRRALMSSMTNTIIVKQKRSRKNYNTRNYTESLRWKRVSHLVLACQIIERSKFQSSDRGITWNLYKTPNHSKSSSRRQKRTSIRFIKITKLKSSRGSASRY